jgi:SAM-dependent methyltransferase
MLTHFDRWLGICACLLVCWFATPVFAVPTASASVYQTRWRSLSERESIHSPDGIGKFYMGREIAKVMGHTEAMWLERSTREVEEKPTLVMRSLDLQPTDTVADIGAGTGYFSFRMAKLVPKGQVLAVDIQPEMIDILNFLKNDQKITNVEPVLGNETSPNLPTNTVDLALMVDAYHEFNYPREMMSNIVTALKPGGRVVLVEYRGENPFIPIKGLHKMTQKQVKKEMAAVGLKWVKTQDNLPQQHILVFTKPT